MLKAWVFCTICRRYELGKTVKFVTDNIYLIVLAVSSGLMLLWPMITKRSGGIENVTPMEAVVLMNRNSATVVDVSDEAEFDQGHITGAMNIPLAQLPDRLKELEKFHDKPLIVNCRSGMRSGKACGILAKQQFSKLYNLQGGLQGWQEAKLPLTKERNG